MKKFLMMMFMFILPAVAFVSCGDDDDDKDKDEPGTSIIGRYYDVYEPTDYIELKSGGVAIEFIADEGKDGETTTGTYVYNAPNITINIDGDVYTGTISGSTMTLNYGVYRKH